jgi:tetratricopeptide (TPR) repeat protein
MRTARQIVARKIALFFAYAVICCLPACDRMVESRGTEIMKDADALAAAGDYAKAVSRYEAALDGTAKTADVHYRLALLYDDKVNEPVNAVHHFRRYLALAPNGSHANDAKKFLQRDELALVTSLSGDAVVPRAEAARLRNENLDLRKQLDDLKAKSAAPAEPKTRRVTPVKSKKPPRKR